jgi:hypothetical protein
MVGENLTFYTPERLREIQEELLCKLDINPDTSVAPIPWWEEESNHGPIQVPDRGETKEGDRGEVASEVIDEGSSELEKERQNRSRRSRCIKGSQIRGKRGSSRSPTRSESNPVRGDTGEEGEMAATSTTIEERGGLGEGNQGKDIVEAL